MLRKTYAPAMLACVVLCLIGCGGEPAEESAPAARPAGDPAHEQALAELEPCEELEVVDLDASAGLVTSDLGMEDPGAATGTLTLEVPYEEVEIIELDECEESAPISNHLLSEIGAYSGSALAGRGSGSRGKLVARYGGSAYSVGTAHHRYARSDEGLGPGWGGDKHDRLVDNPFHAMADRPLSTFSIDVDTASYSKVRMHLMQHGQLPPRDAVRIEELLNYFDYDYEGPEGDEPFAAHVEVATCPWRVEHRLVRIAVKGRTIEREARPSSNLVFLLDVSGSMSADNKLPLVSRGMQMLAEQLRENDRVAIVVYAGAAGMVLPPTTGDRRRTITDALERLGAGGSTNGGAGIHLAYQSALDNFLPGGVNRVILCTDGDFNVGTTSTGELVRLAEQKAKAGVFLSVLAFGMGNHNDAMLEELSNKANGNYAFIDNLSEARKVLVEQFGGTLVTIAKDVKIQVEFNPAAVQAYRLLGYENRMLAAKDFNDDKKDAGEIGAGHTVTALYEIAPAGAEAEVDAGNVDALKYQRSRKTTKAASGGELLTVKIRHKPPHGDTSTLAEFPVRDAGKQFVEAAAEFRFAAAVASFGMLLRGSEHKGDSTFDAVAEIATEALGPDRHGYRREFLALVGRAGEISQR